MKKFTIAFADGARFEINVDEAEFNERFNRALQKGTVFKVSETASSKALLINPRNILYVEETDPA